MKRFVKADAIPSSAAGITKFDFKDKGNCLPHSKIDVGFAAEKNLKVCCFIGLLSMINDNSLSQDLVKAKKISQLQEKDFQNEYQGILSSIVTKMQFKSPLRYTLVQNLTCLNPAEMKSQPEKSRTRFKKILQVLLDAKQLSGGLTAGKSAFVSVFVNTEFLYHFS